MKLKDILNFLGEKNEDLKPHIKPIAAYLDLHAEIFDKLEDLNKAMQTKTPASFSLSQDAVRAFKAVLLPQIELLGTSIDDDDWKSLAAEVAGLGRSKNPSLENSLILHKPVYMQNKKFWEEIQQVFTQWKDKNTQS